MGVACMARAAAGYAQSAPTKLEAEPAGSSGSGADASASPSTAPSPKGASNDTEVDAVVVTANRRSQNVQDVPYAISAVSGTELTRNGLADINGLSHQVPGVNFLDKGPFAGIANNSIIIHGLNVENAATLQANTTEAPVATYVDDAPVFVNLRLNDIDHVEVLRGPQGTLYGSGSLGGTVRFIQNNPDLNQYQVIVNGGTSGTANTHTPNYNGNIIVNLPITSTFALRFQAGDDYEAGFINQPNLYVLGSDGAPALAQPGNELTSAPVYAPATGTNDYSYQSYRVAALWQPTPQLRIRLNYNYQESKAGGAPEINPTIYGYTLNNAAYIRQNIDDRIDLYSGDIAYDLGFATVTASTSVYSHNAFAHDDSTRLYENFSFYTAYYGSDPRPLISDVNILKDQGFTEEVRFASKPSTFIEYVAGAYYSNQHSSPSAFDFYPGYNNYYSACQPVYGFASSQCGFGEFYGVLSQESGVPVQKDLAYLQDVQERFVDRALYGELTYHITSRLQITGGARVFYHTLRETEGSGLLFVGPTDVVSSSSTQNTVSALGSANVSYEVMPTMSTYINWSQGFRRGELNALPAYVPFTNQTTDPRAFSATPDTVNNFEGGIKGTFHHITYDLSAYDIEWNNIQANIQVTAIVLPAVINVGNGYSRGLDLALSGYLTDHIFGQINYSLNESKLTSISAVAVDSASSPFVGGGRFPGVPEDVLNWRFEYQQRVGSDLELRYGVDGNYRSGSPSTISAVSAQVPGFAMWDLYVGASYKAWTARIFCNNVNNTLGITAREDPADVGPAAPYFVSTPRTVGVSFSYTFGKPR
jgi:outer membrane receptor protein involved in Fe transport